MMGFSMKCNCNVGKVDRIVRIIVGVSIMGAGIYWQNGWGLIGLVPFTLALLAGAQDTPHLEFPLLKTNI